MSRVTRIRHTGLTLVEVVVSLVLAATLLVGMLTAYRIHQRQIVRAVRERAAVEAAEPLLASWMMTQVPRQTSGNLRDAGRVWFWRTRPTKIHRLGQGISVETIRFELFAGNASRSQRPVLSLELLRPREASLSPTQLRDRRRAEQ